MKRVVAEMGGKNAIVVDTDADLDQAVPAIVASAFGYAGQKCSAASRVIGIGPVFDELIDRLAGTSELILVGHPKELRHSVGPVVDEDAWKRVRRYQEAARVEGEVVVQRNDLPDGGWYVGPTVMVTDDPSCRVATEEIFGPVLVAMKADDFDQALAWPVHRLRPPGTFSRSPARIPGGRGIPGRTSTSTEASRVQGGRQPFGGSAFGVARRPAGRLSAPFRGAASSPKTRSTGVARAKVRIALRLDRRLGARGTGVSVLSSTRTRWTLGS